MRLGFVGVGAVASAMVRALMTGPNADSLEIVLSPRGAQRSSELATEFPRVRVAESNQAVLDAADMVFIGVLPTQTQQVCGELTFRADHIVASLVAGLPPSHVAPLVAPAATVCQMIPLPVISLHTGPLVVCPAVPAVLDVFAGCGEIVTLDDESLIRVLSCTSASMSTFFEFQKTVIEWTVKVGIPLETAQAYTTALYQGLATEAAAASAAELPHMPGEHETPGGLNEHVRRSMIDAGAFGTLEQALDYIYFHKNLARSDD